MLEVNNLCYERDERYLFKHLSFSLPEGQALQITGANGSGKTTLLKILTGLILPTAGDIYWQQQSIYQDRTAFYATLLYLGHLSGISARLTPKENLIYYLKLWSASLEAHHLSQTLSAIGLANYADTPCYLLSAGQQRRVALARLMLSAAKIWILDEPLTSLDQQGIQFVEQCLIQHIDKKGSLIVTSHQPLSLGNVYLKDIALS